MIKLFEDYMEYYYKLNSDEWNKDVGKYQSCHLKEFNDYQISRLVSFGFKDDDMVDDYKNRFFIRCFDKYDITEVIMCEDEWIYVGNHARNYYYKCDQFEGLLKLFNDIGINEVKPSIWNRIKPFSRFKSKNQ